MESKLQRLSNAWDQFTMGLTNNEILKGAVDLLADMIEGVNKLTNGLSAGNGLIKSVVSLGVALGGLTMGK
jgi:predicted secreted Zn-dependent protease